MSNINNCNFLIYNANEETSCKNIIKETLQNISNESLTLNPINTTLTTSPNDVMPGSLFVGYEFPKPMLSSQITDIKSFNIQNLIISMNLDSSFHSNANNIMFAIFLRLYIPANDNHDALVRDIIVIDWLKLTNGFTNLNIIANNISYYNYNFQSNISSDYQNFYTKLKNDPEPDLNPIPVKWVIKFKLPNILINKTLTGNSFELKTITTSILNKVIQPKQPVVPISKQSEEDPLDTEAPIITKAPLETKESIDKSSNFKHPLVIIVIIFAICLLLYFMYKLYISYIKSDQSVKTAKPNKID